MRPSELSNIIISSCEYFDALQNFGGIPDEEFKVDGIRYQSNIRLFFQQVERFPDIIDFGISTICDIMVLSEYFLWKHKDEYIKMLYNVDSYSNYRFSRIVRSSFIIMNKNIDKFIVPNMIHFNHNRYVIPYEICLQIGKTYYDKFKFPCYYKLHENFANKMLHDICGLLCSKIKLNNYAIITGGLVTGLFIGEIYDDSDCDIFEIDTHNIINPGEFITINGDFYSACYENFKYIYNTNPDAKIKKIQIINFGYKNKYEIINSFDLDINKIFICESGIYMCSNSYEQIIHKKIDCSKFNNDTILDKTKSRLAKYKNRGFELVGLNTKIEIPEYKKELFDNFESFKNSVKFIDNNKWTKNEYIIDGILEPPSSSYKSLNCKTKFIKFNFMCHKNVIQYEIKDAFIKKSQVRSREVMAGTYNVVITLNKNTFENEISGHYGYHIKVSQYTEFFNLYTTTFRWICKRNIKVNGHKCNVFNLHELKDCYIIITYITKYANDELQLYLSEIDITYDNCLNIDDTKFNISK